MKRLLRILTPNVPWGHFSPNNKFSKGGWGCKWHHFFSQMLCDNTCEKNGWEKNPIETITFLLLFITNTTEIGVHLLAIFQYLNATNSQNPRAKTPCTHVLISLFKQPKLSVSFYRRYVATYIWNWYTSKNWTESKSKIIRRWVLS